MIEFNKSSGNGIQIRTDISNLDFISQPHWNCGFWPPAFNALSDIYLDPFHQPEINPITNTSQYVQSHNS
ncbi:hypothetical protein DSO57_1028258 [Entomophthora muscae]|uniref:Uncharacterized protein n=1 Tax=Entomophthora muscae TaxID=34485 RepID=A0ACC2ULX9_9FUNG|nr:hypothetical protein DSO57_1028258 [Entomophthora muscae]